MANDAVYSGTYREVWRLINDPVRTEQEVRFLASLMEDSPGARVLDIMSGYGRHSIPLAQQGFVVTAVDSQGEYVEDLNNRASELNVKIESIEADVLEWDDDRQWQMVTCMGNSLGKFNEEHLASLFERIGRRLERGGVLVMQMWTIAETWYSRGFGREWYEVEDYTCLIEYHYLPFPSRAEWRHRTFTKDGLIDTTEATEFIYSLNELGQLLSRSGLHITDIYKDTDGGKFTVGAEQAIVVVRRA